MSSRIARQVSENVAAWNQQRKEHAQQESMEAAMKQRDANMVRCRPPFNLSSPHFFAVGPLLQNTDSKPCSPCPASTPMQLVNASFRANVCVNVWLCLINAVLHQ